MPGIGHRRMLFEPERLAALRSAYEPASFTRAELLDDRYQLAHEGRFRVYYAPTDAWPADDARLVLVGLTPGFSQVHLAAQVFSRLERRRVATPSAGPMGIATTSALVYPVFAGPDRCDLTGIRDLRTVRTFRAMLEELLAPRLNRAAQALIVPLGTAAASGVRYLCDTGDIARERVRWGLPRPSDAGDWRIRHFRRIAI